jgi:hypothetical protein
MPRTLICTTRSMAPKDLARARTVHLSSYSSTNSNCLNSKASINAWEWAKEPGQEKRKSANTVLWLPPPSILPTQCTAALRCSVALCAGLAPRIRPRIPPPPCSCYTLRSAWPSTPSAVAGGGQGHGHQHARHCIGTRRASMHWHTLHPTPTPLRAWGVQRGECERVRPCIAPRRRAATSTAWCGRASTAASGTRKSARTWRRTLRPSAGSKSS